MNQKKQPMRKCIGCQEMRLKKELIRVIRTPEGEICIDATGKKNGIYAIPWSVSAKQIKQKVLNVLFSVRFQMRFI